MVDFSSNNPEKNDRRLPEAPSVEKQEGGKESKDIQKESEKFIEGVSEVVEGTEIAESNETGEISEVTGEDKKKGPSGQIKGGTTTGAKDDRKKEIEYPKIEVMQEQIAHRINKEIASLEKEAKRMIKNPMRFSPFQFAQVIRKIRSLKDILADLAHATSEALKNWWMSFVKDKD